MKIKFCEHLFHLPIVVSENFSLAISSAKFGPTKTETSMSIFSLITSDAVLSFPSLLAAFFDG